MTAAPSTPQPVVGRAILCFVPRAPPAAAWFQGHVVLRGGGRALGLLGEQVAPPSSVAVHECCYPHGPPEFYDVTVVDHGRGADVRLEGVEKGVGLLGPMQGARLRWAPDGLLLDAEAAEAVARFFPGVVFTPSVHVAVGELELNMSDESVSTDDDAATAHVHCHHL
eukprot:Unigene15130_Nuclearia_a/m.45301 Unigene15130_Nuclearia_a/g.45301  ORF Unigene15130_Nuclearia_a/g.45301 Unigene15130_Nuclearia_a/m.45301 type:complete len:167 (+) Unigene15130_Nuclearia_a:192-692(+)